MTGCGIILQTRDLHTLRTELFLCRTPIKHSESLVAQKALCCIVLYDPVMSVHQIMCCTVLYDPVTFVSFLHYKTCSNFPVVLQGSKLEKVYDSSVCLFRLILGKALNVFM